MKDDQIIIWLPFDYKKGDTALLCEWDWFGRHREPDDRRIRHHQATFKCEDAPVDRILDQRVNDYPARPRFLCDAHMAEWVAEDALLKAMDERGWKDVGKKSIARAAQTILENLR